MFTFERLDKMYNFKGQRHNASGFFFFPLRIFGVYLSIIRSLG